MLGISFPNLHNYVPFITPILHSHRNNLPFPIKTLRYESPEVSVCKWKKKEIQALPNFQGCFLVISSVEELFKNFLPAQQFI